MICNCCGKELPCENGIDMEDALEITKNWGYFSHKDLESHHMCICEECYDKWIATFAIPVEIKDIVQIF